MHRALTLIRRPSERIGRVPLIPASVAALEARQLRLLAYAVGDHLPVELAAEVVELERHRRELLAAGTRAP